MYSPRRSTTLPSSNLQKNKGRRVYGLKASYIEFLHDRGIALAWPNAEPVSSRDCIQPNLLESAARQPFQSGFGVEYYPTLTDKAACLFFSIAGGHIFGNGNKRTAVLSLDLFLLANSVYSTISNDEMVELAQLTASYNERGEDREVTVERIRGCVANNSIELRFLRLHSPALYRKMHRTKNDLRLSTFFETVPDGPD